MIQTEALLQKDTAEPDAVASTTRELVLLENIETDPDVTQASLAAQLGVAVGTINWHLKRLVAKGYVKVKRAQRRKLRYIITPEGLAFRARLTVNYIENSLLLYRKTRQHVCDLLHEVRQAGYDYVRIEGEGDIADICRLTCLEQNIKVMEQVVDQADGLDSILDLRFSTPISHGPILQVRGTKVVLNYNNTEHRFGIDHDANPSSENASMEA